VLEPGAPLRFVHPVVRTAIYEDIPRAERAEMHARAAQLIAAESAEPEAVAIHLLAAEPAGEERVVELLRNAARAALSRGAPETAALYLRRAVEEPPSAPIHSELALELASAAARAGDSDALQLLSSAFTTAKRQPLRARAGLQLGAALLGTVARIGEAIDVLEHALEGVHDPELATRLEAMLLLGGVSTPAAHGRVAGRLARTRARVDDFPLDQARPLLSPLSWHLVVADGDAAGGARLAERALGGGELLREEIKTGMVLTAPPIWALSLAGHLEIAERAADDVIAQARARGARIVLARASAFRASVRHRRGRLAGAEADARSCIELAGASAQPLLHPIASASLIAVLLERADTEAARQALRDVEVGLYDPELAPTQPLRESRARLLMAEGDPRGALEELLAYARWEREWQAGAGVVPVAWRSSAALASKMLGDAARARRLAEEELELARGFGVAAPIGTALRTLALVEGRESGIELLDEAVSVLQESEARLEYARAVTDLGAMLRHVGLRSMAIPKLRDGMDAAHRCGATALVDFAREELRLAGARPTRIALTGRDALTPAERRVAALACDGMRNKEIAQALFVTQRTVEMHLSNAYRKLGVSSREELPSALEDQ
jgi:DNA-binding CsgD family transcriptional regulator